MLVPPEEQEAPPVAMILSMDQHTMEKLMGKLFLRKYVKCIHYNMNAFFPAHPAAMEEVPVL